MMEPSRHQAGEGAARARVEAVFKRIDAFGYADLQTLPVPVIDSVAREADLAFLEEQVGEHGRGELLGEARERVRDHLLQGSPPPHNGLYSVQPRISSGSVEDQVARAMAIEDVVSVAVAEDLLDPNTISALSTPGRRLLRLAPLEPPESAIDWLDVPTAFATEPLEEEPLTPEEAAAAEEEASARRQQKAALFVAIAVVALVIAFSNGADLLGVLVIVGAIVLVAWLIG